MFMQLSPFSSLQSSIQLLGLQLHSLLLLVSGMPPHKVVFSPSLEGFTPDALPLHHSEVPSQDLLLDY